MSEQITDWSYDKLVDWFKDRGRGVTCFCGDKCKCGITANVPEMGGWFCACGAYNVLGFAGNNQRMHDNPDQGPALRLVAAAMKANGLP